MTKSEIATLLGLCAAYDRRTVGEMDVDAWHAILSDLDFADAKQAVMDHYAAENAWIMPADVRRGTKRIRDYRWEHRSADEVFAELDRAAGVTPLRSVGELEAGDSA